MIKITIEFSSFKKNNSKTKTTGNYHDKSIETLKQRCAKGEITK